MISSGRARARTLGFWYSAADSDSSPPETKHPPFAGAIPELTEARILYVEDNEDLLFLVADRLRSEGFVVAEAPTKTAAETLLGREMFDLVLLDLMLPDGDGLDLLSEIRRDPRLRGIPVLILSGRGDDMTMAEGYCRGADGYLVKSGNFDDFALRIRALLAQPRGTS